MTESPAPTRPLLDIARELLSVLDSLEPLDPLDPALGLDPRDPARVLLRTKVVPELANELRLPVFVGVQGGTNTGKSTLFNALAGKLLSPAAVVAAATKHPLLYLHARWRATFLGQALFPGIECLELADPRELLDDADRSDVLYLRFHDDERMSHLALIDSPDFDSSLHRNALQAAAIAAISDITLFVTTAQKYRDRVLVEELRKLLDLKGRVVVVFNLVEEAVVFETLVDDLRSALPEGLRSFEAISVPASRHRFPEEDIGPPLRERVLGPLTLLDAGAVKPEILGRTLRRLGALTRALLGRYSIESAFKREVAGHEEEMSAAIREDYARGLDLGFPEETLAIRRVLRLTEASGILALPSGVESASRWLALLGSAGARLNDTVRRTLIRLSAGDEGTLESAPTALAEYAANRDRADGERVLLGLETLRVHVETFVRNRLDASALARALMRALLTPAFASGFAGEVRRVHDEALRSTGESGADWLPAVGKWIEEHPGRVRALRAAAMALKVGLGGLVAWALPPARGLLGFVSPIKWISFGAGYLVGAYVVVLLVSLTMKRRARFLAARRKAFDETLQRVIRRPLAAAMEAIVPAAALDRVDRLVGDMERESPVKGRGPSPDRRTGDTGRSAGDRATGPSGRRGAPRPPGSTPSTSGGSGTPRGGAGR